ncbi:hypothetical protein ACN20G_13965 [Streptomyces sp. BI20]|uniref:hypothetical protein n=1 Tax=Streptomyces sp. BI20 TaxID=3403460 RepID=UPI003C758218
MPTPYGSRGGMAFSAAELHVLRRSLAHALRPDPAPLPAPEVRETLSLARSVDDALGEAERQRAFLLADLARYRAALPGSLSGWLTLLREALDSGCEPVPDDLAALRALRGNPEAAALLDRVRAVAERSVRRRLATGTLAVGAPRARLLALTGGREEAAPGVGPTPGPGAPTPAPTPHREPRTPRGAARGTAGPERAPERPERPVPTPGEVFPRRRPQDPGTPEAPLPETADPRPERGPEAVAAG